MKRQSRPGESSGGRLGETLVVLYFFLFPFGGGKKAGLVEIHKALLKAASMCLIYKRFRPHWVVQFWLSSDFQPWPQWWSLDGRKQNKSIWFICLNLESMLCFRLLNHAKMCILILYFQFFQWPFLYNMNYGFKKKPNKPKTHCWIVFASNWKFMLILLICQQCTKLILQAPVNKPDGLATYKEFWFQWQPC